MRKPPRPCQVCDANEFNPWRWEGLENCTVCGHVRKCSWQDGEAAQHVYFDNKDFAGRGDAFTRFYENLNARRRLRELRRYRRNGRVLEVGVGLGSLLHALSLAGYETEGVDLSPKVCDAVQLRYQLTVYCDRLETYGESALRGVYDVIIMCHVLEHMESLSSSLQAVHRLLKQDGLLYLAVPNLLSWNASLPGWTGYESYHVHYFHLASLRRLLDRMSFNILYEKTFEPLTGWFNAMVRSTYRHSPNLRCSVSDGRPSIQPQGLLWSVYNLARIMTGAALWPLRSMQSALGYGEELVVIAQPQRW